MLKLFDGSDEIIRGASSLYEISSETQIGQSIIEHVA